MTVGDFNVDKGVLAYSSAATSFSIRLLCSSKIFGKRWNNSSYTPACPAHILGKGNSTAITKVAARENRQGYINNGYRRYLCQFSCFKLRLFKRCNDPVCAKIQTFNGLLKGCDQSDHIIILHGG